MSLLAVKALKSSSARFITSAEGEVMQSAASVSLSAHEPDYVETSQAIFMQPYRIRLLTTAMERID